MTKTTTERPKRIPVGGARDIITVRDKDPNYVYRWVFDDPRRPGRIQRFQDGGYELVQDDNEIGQKTVDRGSKVGSTISRPDSGGMLVLMRILKEWYDEDQAAKQKAIDATEGSMLQEIKEGRIPGESEPGYGHIKFQRTR
jgi:hypothetical protein